MNNFLTINENKIKINEGERRIGKDEMNLIELPFTLLTKKNPKELKTIERTWTSKGEDGKEKQFYKIITGSAKWGLPTFIGEELYLACMELLYRQGFESRTVYTTQYEILKLMRWPVNNGESCECSPSDLKNQKGLLGRKDLCQRIHPDTQNI